MFETILDRSRWRKERVSISGVYGDDEVEKGAKCPRSLGGSSPRCANETRAKLIEHPSQLRWPGT